MPPPGWRRLHELDPNAAPVPRPEPVRAAVLAIPAGAPHDLAIERDGERVSGMPIVPERRARRRDRGEEA